MPDKGWENARFREHFADARPPHDIDRPLIEEAPVAIEINGIGYAVMMATPTDLADYAAGFLLSEQIIADPAELLSTDAQPVADGGWMLRVTVSAGNAAPLLERARLRLSEGSCGLCGIESLEQVLRPLAPVTARLDVSEAALFAAAGALRDRQPLGRTTGAAHAAAFCDGQGRIVAVREDVGRHNALDKLIGHLAIRGISPAEGFILLSARCSFELVQKTVIAGCPVLATISAASTLAAEQARAHGVRLYSLLRSDSVLESRGE
ncbi:formate dehydrogenase accessory sulfurtransferase FdhD [Novosphingobium sp. ZN18A2]|uniref:formate dehydrogenase accessory sulfurtransferase FdhD n=1 Tax=Novosphingobium sp. ZN18A2 TaxID=3079861 RepID=UPI0030CAA206